MSDPLETELIHLKCEHCGKMTTLSFASLNDNDTPMCPYCGQPTHIDLEAARADASRKALELDQSVDSLGSAE
jgi:NAD-dependent SIR2 family protein deacetylase